MKNGTKPKVLRKLADLVPDDRNANRGTERGLGMLEASLRDYGAGRSVLLDKNGKIIAGNKTIESAVAIGLDKLVVVPSDGRSVVAVQRTDLDLDVDSKARELALADNRVSEVDLAWDAEVLAELGKEIDLSHFWHEDELKDLLGELAPEPKEAPEPKLDQAEELQKQWKTAPGQIWAIPSTSVYGMSHRLACGDSKSTHAVGSLFGDALASICVTSPPYGDAREYGLGKFDWDGMMCGVWDQIVAHSSNEAHILVNLGLLHRDRRVQFYWQKWLDHAERTGYPLFGWYVWDKGSALPGQWNGRLAPAHEFIFHFNLEPGTINKWIRSKTVRTNAKADHHTFRQTDGSLKPATSPDKIGQPFKVPDSVIRATRHIGSDIGHPAMFSSEFAAFLVQTWSTKGDIVFEPFCGAATTMVACEEHGRICYGMEIEPTYVAVSLERLSDMGLKPKLTKQ